MAVFQPVTISKGSFAFCRATIAILLWASIVFQIKWLIFYVFFIMLLSAVYKVERAPLILLYQITMDKIKPSEKIVVDENGIYVSHVVGTLFAAICIVLLYTIGGIVAWCVTVLFAVLQTSAAIGFCSALKLYQCMTGGNCCNLGKLVKKVQDKHV